MDEPLANDILRLCTDLPIQQKSGYLEFLEMHILRVVGWCCKDIFENNKLNEIEHNFIQKRNVQDFQWQKVLLCQG